MVSANGKLVTSDSEIVIQPLETSVVRSVAVKMGQKVKAGEVLATLDPTFTEGRRGRAQRQVAATSLAAYDRLAAETCRHRLRSGQPQSGRATQRDIFHKRREEYARASPPPTQARPSTRRTSRRTRPRPTGSAEQIRLSGEAEDIYQTLVAENLASQLQLIETSQRGSRPIAARHQSRRAAETGRRDREPGSRARMPLLANGGASSPRRWRKTRSDRDRRGRAIVEGAAAPPALGAARAARRDRAGGGAAAGKARSCARPSR